MNELPASEQRGPRVTIGIADMGISKDPTATLITYALGSCVGIALFDPVAKVGGVMHALLPQSKSNPEKAAANPYMFVDTGVPAFFKACYAVGAVKERLVVRIAGGAAVSRSQSGGDHFKIGKRNTTILRKLLWKNNVLLKSHDVGGNVSRTMWLDMATGRVFLKINGTTSEL